MKPRIYKTRTNDHYWILAYRQGPARYVHIKFPCWRDAFDWLKDNESLIKRG